MPMATHCIFWIHKYNSRAMSMSMLVTTVQPSDLTLGIGPETSPAPFACPTVMWPGNWLIAMLAEIGRITLVLGQGSGQRSQMQDASLEKLPRQRSKWRPEDRVRGPLMRADFGERRVALQKGMEGNRRGGKDLRSASIETFTPCKLHSISSG